MVICDWSAPFTVQVSWTVSPSSGTRHPGPLEVTWNQLGDALEDVLFDTAAEGEVPDRSTVTVVNRTFPL